MKQIIKSRIVTITLTVSLLFTGLSFLGVRAPISGGNVSALSLIPSNGAIPLNPIEDKPFISPEVLKSESAAIEGYVKAAIEYKNELEALSSSASPDSTRIGQVEAKLRTLRNRAPQFETAARSVVTKLKGAGKWSAELDTHFESRQGVSADFIAEVKREGGFRSYYEKTLLQLKKVSEDFDQDEKNLNGMKAKKVSLLMRVQSLLTPRVYAAVSLGSCGTCAQLALNIMLCFGLGGISGGLGCFGTLDTFRRLCGRVLSRCT